MEALIKVTVLLFFAYYVNASTANATVTFNVTSLGGLEKQFQYPSQRYSECYYDEVIDLLRCMKNYSYAEVTSIWKKTPELIKYVKLNCLMTNPKRQGACLCKDVTSVPRDRSQEERYYSCQLKVLNASAFRDTKSMEVLDLSDNLLNDIDRGAFAGLTSLRYCSLDRNILRDLPGGLFCDTPNIEFVSLNGLMLDYFPSHSFHCKTPLTKLTVLDARGSNQKDVPADSLDYLPALRSLDLGDNNLGSIYKKSFAGATGLEHLNLSGNELSELFPHFCNYMQNLTHLHLQNNRFTVINVDEFDDCSKLLELDLSKNLISEFTGNASSLMSIVLLNVSRNNITLIGVDFQGHMQLETIDLSQNRLSHLSDNQFRSLGNMKYLNLSTNSLNNSDNFVSAFDKLGMLEMLDLSNNKLSVLSNSSFVTLSNLKILLLSKNEIVDLKSGAFTGLDALEHLALDNNKLSSLDENLLTPLKSLKHLFLSRNNLVTADFTVLPNIVKLEIYNNGLTSLPPTLPLSDLEYLDISNNNLTVFVGTNENRHVDLSKMKYLDMSFNRISDVSPKVFQTMKSIMTVKCHHNQLELNLTQSLFINTQNLTHLSLAHNNIKGVRGMFSQNSLAGLLELNLSSNPLGMFDTLGSDSSAKLEMLDITNCSLSNIDSSMFASFQNLKSVYFENNKFETFPAFNTNWEAIFFFTGNPLICACNMSWLLSDVIDVDGSRVLVTNYKLPKCTLYTEPGLFNPRILERRQFLCPSEFDCDPVCSCFKTNETGTVTQTFCRKNLKVIPSLISTSALAVFLDGNDFSEKSSLSPFLSLDKMKAKELYMNNSAISNLDPQHFQAFDDLEILNLEDNVIEVLPTGIFENKKHLRQIYLKNNLLQVIEPDVFKNLPSLDELDISGNSFVSLTPNTLKHLSASNARYFFLASNPWACNCTNRAFKDFVDAVEPRIRDRRTLFCDETYREIVQLSKSSFTCSVSVAPHQSGKPALIVGIIVAILVVIFLSALFVYYRRELLALLYSKTGCRIPSRKHFPGMHFDVFITYDPSDQHCSFYVQNTLLPKLKNNAFNVQTSGDVIEDAEVVQKVIEDSRASIFIVSKNFTSNTFQQRIFLSATRTNKRNSEHKVLLIIHGDIDLHVMEPEVMRRLSSGDYITSRAKLWWERLIYELPKPSGLANAAENDDVSESDVIVFSSLNRDQYDSV